MSYIVQNNHIYFRDPISTVSTQHAHEFELIFSVVVANLQGIYKVDSLEYSITSQHACVRWLIYIYFPSSMTISYCLSACGIISGPFVSAKNGVWDSNCLDLMTDVLGKLGLDNSSLGYHDYKLGSNLYLPSLVVYFMYFFIY